MKQKKTHQLRIRITESQLSSIVQYIVDHPNEFKNQSDLIRESIKSRISRTKDIRYRYQENQGDFVPQLDKKGINPFERFKKNSDFIRIYELMSPVFQTNKDVYLIAEKVFEVFNSVLDEYEEKCLVINHNVLFELSYKIVERTIHEIQRTKYNSIDDLTVLNLNTLSLFIEPTDITDEELLFSNRFIENENEEYEVDIKLPKNAQRNYIINFKRILDENNSNPDFNESILNMFDRLKQNPHHKWGFPIFPKNWVGIQKG